MSQQSNSLQKSQQMRAMNKLYNLSHQALFECTKLLLFTAAEKALEDGGYSNPTDAEKIECMTAMIPGLAKMAKEEAKLNYRPIKPKPRKI